MTSRGHALSRDELIRTLTAFSGITTADGLGDGTTLVDTNLKDSPFIAPTSIPEKAVLIMSGDARGQDKGASSFDNATGTITFQGTGFSAQIKAGTIYRILNISSVEIDVAAINTKIGTNVDAAGTTTLFAYLAKIFASGDDIEGKLDSPAYGLTAIMVTLAAINAKLVDPAAGLAAIINTIAYYGAKLDDPAGLGGIPATLTAFYNMFVDPASGFGAIINTISATLTKLIAVQGGTETLESLDDELDAILDVARTPSTTTLSGYGTPNELYNKTDTTPFFVPGVWLGLENMEAGDVIRFRAYRDWDDASIADQVSDDELWTFGGAQTPKWVYKPLNIYCTYEFKITGETLAGTDRIVHCEIYDAQRGS